MSEQLRNALIGAANYIDTLGGDSKAYRAALSTHHAAPGVPQQEASEHDARVAAVRKLNINYHDLTPAEIELSRAAATAPGAPQQEATHWLVTAPCGEGVVFDNERDAQWTLTGKGAGSDGFGTPTIGEAFRDAYEGETFTLVELTLGASRAAATAPGAPQQEASGDWSIDRSCGRPILVYQGCSVIEAEQAEYVLGLIRAAATAPAELEQQCLQAWGLPEGYLDAWREGRAKPDLATAPADCDRCKGSGEDPEGFYNQSKGPDGDTHDGPCRSCGGSGSAPAGGVTDVERSAILGLAAYAEGSKSAEVVDDKYADKLDDELAETD